MKNPALKLNNPEDKDPGYPLRRKLNIFQPDQETNEQISGQKVHYGKEAKNIVCNNIKLRMLSGPRGGDHNEYREAYNLMQIKKKSEVATNT